MYLLIPFFLIRFGLLSLCNPTAVKRAAHFAPIQENEKMAYWLYQLSNVAILLCLLFLKIQGTPRYLFFTGGIVYLVGVLLLVFAILHFAAPAANGINCNGLYRISRNPMYVAYFVYFLGCVLLTQSLVLLGAVLVFQVTTHWIILSEERWCIKNFGDAYLQYMKQVRRYL